MLALALAIAATTVVTAQQTITYTPTAGVPTYAVRPPVLTIKPGTTVVTQSFSQKGDYYEGGAWPGEVGPFHIEGAAAGDTLVVKILKLTPNRDTAVVPRRRGHEETRY